VRLDAANQISETAGRTVTINGSGLLNLNGFNETVANLSFSGGSISGAGSLTVNGTLSFTSGGSISTAAVSALTSPSFVNASVLGISSGGDLSNTNGRIGSIAGSNATVNVTGAGSTWTNSGELNVDNGALNINAGGYVSYSGLGIIGKSSQVAIDGSGSTLAITAPLDNNLLSIQEDGSLHVTNGGLVNGFATRLGDFSSSDLTATALVSGAGSKWMHTDDLEVGYDSDGRLDITNGGQVTSVTAWIGKNSGKTGEVTVDGMGSTWTTVGLSIGESGDGTLNITNGGLVTDPGVLAPAGSFFIGGAADAIGKATIDGADSRWRAGRILYVGYEGQGTLEITNGGGAASTEIRIAQLAGSTGSVSVDGSGSVLYAQTCALLCGGDGGLRVGTGASGVSGSLSIANGGFVFSDFARIEGATSWAIVDGDGSYWGTGSLTVQATLTVSGGGDVGSGTSYVGRATGSNGIVTVDGVGSTWTNSEELYLGYDDITPETHGMGILAVINDGVVSATTVVVGETSEIRGNGDIVGNVQNGGRVSPGTSPGALLIDGNYTQTVDGELLIELAASSYDQLLTTGDAMLAGTLTVNLLDGFIPGIGQSFTIFTSDDVNGTFSAEVLPTVPNLAFDVIYNAQSVVLTVVPALPGDFNANGIVDAPDYVVWRKGLGTIFGQSDYEIWRSHFGQSAGSGSGASINSSAAVPEPSALALSLLALAGGALRRMRIPLAA
jgi:T5SS/PEP-CTERM-associated repeat protein